VIAWKKSQGKPVYPDANSTLRVTYGTVSPYSPKDGITKGPFTTVEGIVEKHTGKEPFNAPQAAGSHQGQALRPVQGSGAGHRAGRLPDQRRHHRRQFRFGGDEQARAS
jgi:hypothetical protein